MGGYHKSWRDFAPTTRTERMSGVPDEPKRPKFHNRKTLTSDGVLCDSKSEAARWEELLMQVKWNAIRDLLPHPSFPLHVNGTRTGRITFDALYTEHGRLVCEDTKSPTTAQHPAYRQRLRTFMACYPHITVREHIV